MYLGQLSDKELLSHLDLTSTDPLILRLVEIVRNAHGGLIDDLIDEGMDIEDYTFKDGYHGDYHYAPKFIRHLRDDRAYWKDEYHLLQDEVEELKSKLKERETLTVAKLIEELRFEIDQSVSSRRLMQSKLERAQYEHEEMRKKLDMWDTMRTP